MNDRQTYHDTSCRHRISGHQRTLCQQFAYELSGEITASALLVALLPPLLFGASWQPWIYNVFVLLVIACPCALLISTRVSIVAALATAARAGLLVIGGSSDGACKLRYRDGRNRIGRGNRDRRHCLDERRAWQTLRVARS